MYKQILVPVDLGRYRSGQARDRDRGRRWRKASGGAVRLINVMPMTPVMLAEYVPPDFDMQQRKSAEEALAIVARECGSMPRRISSDGAPGRHLS